MSESQPNVVGGDDSLLQLVEQLSDPARAERALAELWVRVKDYMQWRVAGLVADRHQALVSLESVANQAYHQFITQHQDGKLRIKDRHGLLGLLGTIAVRRLVDRVRRLDAKRRHPHAAAPPEWSADSPSTVISDADVARLFDEWDEAGFEAADGRQLGAGRAVAAPVLAKADYRVSHPVDAAAPDSQPGQPAQERFFADFDPILRQVFQETVDALPADLREVFTDVYVHKRTDDEIAERMDISVKLVRRKIDSIRQAFLDLRDDSMLERVNRRNRTHRSP